MRSSLSCALMVLVVSAHAQERRDPSKEDLVRLQGKWVVVAFEKDGVTLSGRDLLPFGTLTIKGQEYRWSDDALPGTLKLDAAKIPREVDYTSGGGDHKVELAIYEIKGDTWRDCIAPPGKPRPRDFAAPKGSGFTLITYRRVP